VRRYSRPSLARSELVAMRYLLATSLARRHRLFTNAGAVFFFDAVYHGRLQMQHYRRIVRLSALWRFTRDIYIQGGRERELHTCRHHYYESIRSI